MNHSELDQLNRIIDDALDLEPSRRKAFIQEACKGNKVLQERVFRLIRRCIYPAPPDFLQPPKGVRRVTGRMYEKFLEGGNGRTEQ